MPHLHDDPFHCSWCEREARAAADPQPHSQAAPRPSSRWEFEPHPDEIGDEPVKTLGAFRVGDCVTLTRLPAGLLEEIDEEERADYESLVGDRFEIAAMMAPNIVDLARNCRGPNGEEGTGEWGWEVFTMPLELLAPAAWDDVPDA